MIAIARTAGRIAHSNDQHETQRSRIGRPSHIYTVADLSDYVSVDKR
jgi:citrate synthase